MNAHATVLTSSPLRRLESSGLFQALSGAGDGAFAVGVERRILVWNQAAERLLGYSSAEVIDRPCCDVFVPVCPHTTSGVDESGERHGVPSFDLRVRRRTGEGVWLSISTLTLPPENGEGPVSIYLFRRIPPAARPAPEPGPEEPAAREGAAGPLTAREMEVLRLLAIGANTRVAAQRLGVSPSTIRNHVQNMFMKLGVHSRLEAVAYGRANNLL